MPRNSNDVILTLSINAKTAEAKAMAERVMAVIRAMPEYATDDAELDKDTRRGGFSFRYEPFVFHPQQ